MECCTKQCAKPLCKITCKDGADAACHQHGHQAWAGGGHLGVLVDLDQQVGVLQQQDDGLAVCAKGQAQQVAVGGVYSEADLLELKGARAQALGALSPLNGENLWHLNKHGAGQNAVAQRLQAQKVMSLYLQMKGPNLSEAAYAPCSAAVSGWWWGAALRAPGSARLTAKGRSS